MIPGLSLKTPPPSPQSTGIVLAKCVQQVLKLILNPTFINRPGVAGAVLQTPPSLID